MVCGLIGMYIKSEDVNDYKHSRYTNGRKIRMILLSLLNYLNEPGEPKLKCLFAKKW